MRKKRKAGPARAARAMSGVAKYLMRLYVTGATPKSTRAITNLRRLCDLHLPGKYELKIIDVYQQPQLAREGQLVAVPTLVKAFPLPLRRFIGDMSNTETLLAGLDIQLQPAAVSGKAAVSGPAKNSHAKAKSR